MSPTHLRVRALPWFPGLSAALFAFMLATLAGARPGFAERAPNANAHAHPVRRHASKEQIEALEQQWRTAVLADDVTSMDKLLADDFVGISMSGQVNTKSMQLDRLRTKAVSLTRLELSDVKVKLVGSVAIATSLSQIEGMVDGQPVRGTFRATRIYQRLPAGTWKITNYEATRVPTPGDRMPRAHPPASATSAAAPVPASPVASAPR